MEYRVIFPQPLRSAPKEDAPAPSGIVHYSSRVEILEEIADPEWVRAKVRDGIEERIGYLKKSALEVRPKETPAEIDPVLFAKSLRFAARRFETNSVFLGAVAWVESRFKNAVNPSTQATGPYQFLPSTWQGMVAQYGADQGIGEDDIQDPSAQVVFAAIAARDATKSLKKSLGQIPNHAELYSTHLLGLSAATALITGDRNRSINSVLSEVYANRDDTQSFVSKILNGNKRILLDGDNPRSINSMLEAIVERLAKGVVKYQTLIGEPIQIVATNSEPPWLTVAKKEIGTTEDKNPGASNPRIEQYHDSTTYGRPAKDDMAWCASFVSWCMANSGNKIIEKANIRSARAIDWSAWGESIGVPRVGALVVLSPLAEGSSGHVGFIVDESERNISLLGGNQGAPESVCVLDFPKEAVTHYRWFEY